LTLIGRHRQAGVEDEEKEEEKEEDSQWST
jgi:hypothetical protein